MKNCPETICVQSNIRYYYYLILLPLKIGAAHPAQAAMPTQAPSQSVLRIVQARGTTDTVLSSNDTEAVPSRVCRLRLGQFCGARLPAGPSHGRPGLPQKVTQRTIWILQSAVCCVAPWVAQSETATALARNAVRSIGASPQKRFRVVHDLAGGVFEAIPYCEDRLRSIFAEISTKKTLLVIASRGQDRNIS